MCFVDMAKAFNPIRLKKVLDTLNENKIPKEIGKLLEESNRKNTNVRVNNKTHGCSKEGTA